MLPDGLMYRSYLAGVKEPRFGIAWLNGSDRGWVNEVSLGGRAGILRYGTPGASDPRGWQLDIEGAAFPRLDLEKEWDLEAADFRFGVPLTWRRGPTSVKFGYYHLSSHVGDEFLARNPDFERINYVRDSLLLGIVRRLPHDFLVYGEMAYAFHTDGGAEPWEFQFGGEYRPAATGFRGAPFAAINVHLREEVDFGGGLNVQTGWMWRSPLTGSMLRVGMQYYNGKSMQYAFFDDHEEFIGLGIWYDF